MLTHRTEQKKSGSGLADTSTRKDDGVLILRERKIHVHDNTCLLLMSIDKLLEISSVNKALKFNKLCTNLGIGQQIFWG